ncbi:MAG: CPBP family intramembrane glutamic endopeptidase [Brumimicrobium sp.]
MKNNFNALPSFRQAILLFIIGFVAFLFLSMVLNVLIGQLYPEMVELPMSKQMENYPIPFMLKQFLPVQLGLLFLPGFIYWSFNRNDLKQYKTQFEWVLWSILLFICAFFLLPILGEINIEIVKSFGSFDALIVQKELSDKNLTILIGELWSPSFWTAILLIGVVTGIAEELIFRRFLFHHMLKNTGRIGLSLLSSSFVFALLHFNYIQILPLFFFGIILAMMYFVSKSIVPGIILHALNNIVNVYWLSTDTFPTWMEEIDTRITIPFTILLIFLLIYYQKNHEKQ